MLQVLSSCTIVWCKCYSDFTIVQSDITIVLPWQLSTGRIHDYLFCYCPLVGILFEVLRINHGVFHKKIRTCSLRKEIVNNKWWICCHFPKMILIPIFVFYDTPTSFVVWSTTVFFIKYYHIISARNDFHLFICIYIHSYVFKLYQYCLSFDTPYISYKELYHHHSMLTCLIISEKNCSV